MPLFQLQPHDLLFFRDARPMESQSPGGGHGARWPHPAIFFDAIHAALWRSFPDDAAKQKHHFASHSFYRKQAGERIPLTDGGVFFQTLTTAGPFPVEGGEWFFPRPADVETGGRIALPLAARSDNSGLPKPLRYTVGPTSVAAKEPVPAWWSKGAIDAYLGPLGLPQGGRQLRDEDLFSGDWTTGIAIAPDTETQDEEHIYSAQYLRLREGVSMGLWASLPNEDEGEGMDNLFPPDSPATILLAGGQQRPCRVERQTTTNLAGVLPVSRPLPPGGRRLKWVLLSPALFPAVPSRQHGGGWLPTWVEPVQGTVLLARTETSPRNGKTRQERRRSEQRDLMSQCRLVAACVPGPVPITGWSEAIHVPSADTRRRGPRETLLAVRAGSVYYFECSSDLAAQALWQLLSWHGPQTKGVDRVVHRRSSVMGEKGFGLGVCGPWDFFPDPD